MIASPTFNTSRQWTPAEVIDVARMRLEPHQPDSYRIEVIDAEEQADGFWQIFIRPSTSDLRLYDYIPRLAEATGDLAEQDDLDAVLVEVNEP